MGGLLGRGVADCAPLPFQALAVLAEVVALADRFSTRLAPLRAAAWLTPDTPEGCLPSEISGAPGLTPEGCRISETNGAPRLTPDGCLISEIREVELGGGGRSPFGDGFTFGGGGGG